MAAYSFFVHKKPNLSQIKQEPKSVVLRPTSGAWQKFGGAWRLKTL